MPSTTFGISGIRTASSEEGLGTFPTGPLLFPARWTIFPPHFFFCVCDVGRGADRNLSLLPSMTIGEGSGR